MALFGFVLAICFIPGWTGFAIPTGWVLLSCTLPLLMWRKVEVGLEHVLGLAFLAYAVLSLLWTPIPQQGVWDLWNLAILGGCFMFGSTKVDATGLYVGLACGVGVSTLLAFFQEYAGWQGLYQFWHPAGLFVNPGVLGDTAAIVTVAVLASRLWWPALLTAPAIYLSSSRTAVVACAVAALVAIWSLSSEVIGAKAKRQVAIAFTLAVALIAGALVWRSTAHREPNWLTSPTERMAIWLDTASGLTLWGRGAGSFLITYPAFAHHTDTMATRPENAHNDILEYIFQYGLGVLPLALLAALALRPFPCPERYIFITFIALAFFSFPTRIPIEGFLGAFAMGRLCGSRALLRPYRKRGGLVEFLRSRPPSYAEYPTRGEALPLEPVYSNQASLLRPSLGPSVRGVD